MATSTGLGRPADSKNRIVQEFRTRIVTGELHPGSRFPTRSEIERQFGAGPATVQSALESLRFEGFIRVEGKKGTFVADNPPHLSRYAVVFAKEANPANLGQFWWALSRELEHVAGQRPDCQLLAYYEVDGHEDSEDFARLCREVITNRIAGLIFTSHPYQLLNTPLLNQPNIPRVAIMAPDDFAFPVISPDTDSFLTRSLDYLRDQGHRRIAFLNNSSGLGKQLHLHNLLEARGMETRPYWCQTVDVNVREAARNSAHLLMQCRDIPDALVICDDNLVEPATAGLVDAQNAVPKEFAVVAHTNFPYPTPCMVPAKRLGFDIRQVLQLCVDNINAQRHGELTSPVTNIIASFAEEIVLPTSRLTA